ncbi:MAG: tRNA (guanosine(37)-N1)-methyltransferase TrmD [Phycisphaerales bacterium]
MTATRIDILTLFPDLFEPVLSESITGRARKAGIVEWHAHDIRRYASNKHSKVDDRPFGGGPGMVMMCQPLWDCVASVEAQDPRPPMRVLMTPQGRPLTQRMVEELAKQPRLLLIAGHYEGIDERVIDKLAPMEISVGDYVLSGGEIPAMLLVDAVVRLMPGALGHEDSAVEDSFSELVTPSGVRRLLDCPHYTRPREWDGMEVPEILVSGDHEKVARWRLDQKLARTRARRPDLFVD